MLPEKSELPIFLTGGTPPDWKLKIDAEFDEPFNGEKSPPVFGFLSYVYLENSPVVGLLFPANPLLANRLDPMLERSLFPLGVVEVNRFENKLVDTGLETSGCYFCSRGLV